MCICITHVYVMICSVCFVLFCYYIAMSTDFIKQQHTTRQTQQFRLVMESCFGAGDCTCTVCCSCYVLYFLCTSYSNVHRFRIGRVSKPSVHTRQEQEEGMDQERSQDHVHVLHGAEMSCCFHHIPCFHTSVLSWFWSGSNRVRFEMVVFSPITTEVHFYEI